MRFETGKYLDIDDKCFTCVYTFIDQTGSEEGGREQSKPALGLLTAVLIDSCLQA